MPPIDNSLYMALISPQATFTQCKAHTVLFRPDVQSRVTATSELNTCEPASRITAFSEQSTKWVTKKKNSKNLSVFSMLFPHQGAVVCWGCLCPTSSKFRPNIHELAQKFPEWTFQWTPGWPVTHHMSLWTSYRVFTNCHTSHPVNIQSK